jgi:hypothetical protein
MWRPMLNSMNPLQWGVSLGWPEGYVDERRERACIRGPLKRAHLGMKRLSVNGRERKEANSQAHLATDPSGATYLYLSHFSDHPDPPPFHVRVPYVP